MKTSRFLSLGAIAAISLLSPSCSTIPTPNQAQIDASLPAPIPPDYQQQIVDYSRLNDRPRPFQEFVFQRPVKGYSTHVNPGQSVFGWNVRLWIQGQYGGSSGGFLYRLAIWPTCIETTA